MGWELAALSSLAGRALGRGRGGKAVQPGPWRGSWELSSTEPAETSRGLKEAFRERCGGCPPGPCAPAPLLQGQRDQLQGSALRKGARSRGALHPPAGRAWGGAGVGEEEAALSGSSRTRQMVDQRLGLRTCSSS